MSERNVSISVDMAIDRSTVLAVLRTVFDADFAQLLNDWKQDRLQQLSAPNVVDCYYTIRANEMNRLATRINASLPSGQFGIQILDPQLAQQLASSATAIPGVSDAPHSRLIKLLDTPPLAGKRWSTY